MAGSSSSRIPQDEIHNEIPKINDTLRAINTLFKFISLSLGKIGTYLVIGLLYLYQGNSYGPVLNPQVKLKSGLSRRHF